MAFLVLRNIWPTRVVVREYRYNVIQHELQWDASIASDGKKELKKVLNNLWPMWKPCKLSDTKLEHC
jgi:hypothetical protein